MKFLVLVEEDDGAFGAYSPDADEVYAVGTSVEEVVSRFRQGLELLFKLKREEGGELPVPRHIAATVEIDVS